MENLNFKSVVDLRGATYLVGWPMHGDDIERLHNLLLQVEKSLRDLPTELRNELLAELAIVEQR